jgi:hydroxymethylbilane synthase
MTIVDDKNQCQALYLLGGKAPWTKELEVVLKENVVVPVYSLRMCPRSYWTAAISERENPVESDGEVRLVFQDSGRFAGWSVVGTSSVRRVAQLRRSPGLVFLDVVFAIHKRIAHAKMFAAKKFVRSYVDQSE